MTLLSRINLIKKLMDSRKYRDSYVYEHVRNGIPFQIRALRKDREWSQSDLAEAAKTSRTVITRIEDPNYGKLSIKTLLAIASAFDVALLIKFVPFTRLLREYENVSSEALSALPVQRERSQLERWANANTRSATASQISIRQLELGFGETRPLSAYGVNRPTMLEPSIQVSGGTRPTPVANVVSIKTRRPLSQKRWKARTASIHSRRKQTA